MKRKRVFGLIASALIGVCLVVLSSTAINGNSGYMGLNVEALSEVENENNTCYKEHSSGIRMYVPICDPRVPTGIAIPCEPPFFQKVLDYRNCY